VPAGLPPGIVLAAAYWFEECLKRSCTIFQFPPGSNLHGVGKLSEGSVCLTLAKPQTKAPRVTWGVTPLNSNSRL